VKQTSSQEEDLPGGLRRSGREACAVQQDHRLQLGSRGEVSQPRLSGQRGTSAKLPQCSWSTGRFEKLLKQGAFQLRQSSEGIWELKISMSELDPPLTDEGMQVYCPWFHQRLHRVREECGLRSLRQLRAEISFPKNGLTDEAVGRLLQALQRSEIHVTSLNLHTNLIGPQGARQLGDFLRDASFPVYEVHLSHNMIDDESALEMIRLILEHPKYVQRRHREGETVVPLTLKLNNNWIRDPLRVLKKVESDRGNTVSFANNRQVGGPTVNGWLHLFRFDVQDQPCQPSEAQDGHLTGHHRRRPVNEQRPYDRGPVSGPRTLHEAGLPQHRTGGTRHGGGARSSGSGAGSAPGPSSASSSSGTVVARPLQAADTAMATNELATTEDDGEELVAVALVAVPEEASGGEAEEAPLSGSSRCADLAAPADEVESGGSPSELPAGQVLPAEPSVPAGAKAAKSAAAPLGDPLLGAAATEPATSAATPGAPERTPEPDPQHAGATPAVGIVAGTANHLDSSLAAGGAISSGAGSSKSSTAEDDCPASVTPVATRPAPTKMKPKILQRCTVVEEDALREGTSPGNDDPAPSSTASHTEFIHPPMSVRSASSSKPLLPPPPCSTVPGPLEMERWRHSESAALPRLPEEPGEDEDDSPPAAVVHAAPQRLLAVPAKILQRAPGKAPSPSMPSSPELAKAAELAKAETSST